MSDGFEWLDARAARIAAHRVQTGPREDADEGHAAPRASERHDLLLHLIYRDSAGELSERTVLVREVFRRDDVIFLGGHCHLRNTTRVFRSDRIITLANGRTGEVIVEVLEFLVGLAPAIDKTHATMGYREAAPLAWTGSDLTRIKQRSRPLAILMMALAKADGEWHPAELTVLEGMLNQAATACGIKPDVRGRIRLSAEFSALVPSGNLVTRACRAIIADRDAYSDAPRWCRSMIEADGQTRVEELHEYRAIVARLAELSG